MEPNDFPGSEQSDDIEGQHEPVRLDARQRRVFEALTDIDPELGRVYVGAVRALTDPLNPAGAYHAAYSLRDICNMLHEYLNIPYEGPRKGKHLTTKAMILDLDPADPVSKHFHSLGHRFTAHAHLRSPKKQPPRSEDVLSDLHELEEVLLALRGPFYEVHPELDKLLVIDVPRGEHVQKLLALLARPGPARRAYFFDSLEKPGWLGLLREAGFFSNPPEPVQNKEEGTNDFRPWPESRYLARMAEHEPQMVHDIILEILSKRSDIENTPVVADFVGAAMIMPADQAVDIAKRARKWTKKYDFVLPEKLAQLMQKLAEEGQRDEALRLAESLLSLRADDSRARKWREKQQHTSESDPWAGFEPSPEVKAWVDEYRYRHIIEEYFPNVIEAAGFEALNLLCNLLQKAIEIEEREVGGSDYSHVWRPAVEDHQQNLRFTIKEDLVEAIREATKWLIENRPDEAKQLLDELEGRPFSIFRRIALYILSWKPEVDPRRVAERLCDTKLFDDGDMRHEYYLLAQSYFHQLQPEEQEKVLDWLEAGPDLAAYEQMCIAWDGSSPSIQQTESYCRHWQLERLALFKGRLPSEWQQKWHGLVSEMGEPEHPEFSSYHEMRMGIPSPKSAEELNEMTTPELVQFLADWEPPEDEVWGPAPEGLAQELQRAVEAEPIRYAQDAKQFEGLAPTYVGGILRGLVKVRRDGPTFPWEPVLGLCKWVIQEPEPQPTQPPSSVREVDPGWQWTRKTIAELLSVGFQKNELRFELREVAWQILGPLTRDANPTPDYEKTYGGQNSSPAELAINTVRGEAMHSVLKYALWCARHLRPDDPSLAQGPPVWPEIPEVEKVLDHHLEPTNDPSAAIRSVYGYYLPSLVWLSAEWVQANLERIFPKEPEYQYLGEAAWGTYVTCNDPYDIVVDILGDEYGWAVDKLGEQGVDAWRGPGPEKRLAQHLMLLYWRGRLSLEDSLIGQFFLKASPDVRAAALAWIGRNLSDMDDPIGPDDQERLCALLEARIAAAQQDEDKGGVQEELSGFGWWFTSGQLDDDWALRRLSEVLDLTGGVIEPNRLVAERLALLASDQPSAVVACLAKMVEGDREGWRILSWREHARQILSTALGSGQEEAQNLARDTINSLGERGIYEFRDLLEH